LYNLFEGEAKVTKMNIYGRLSDIDNDLMIFPSYLWESGLTLGSRGDRVKALQQVLINDGFWESEFEATGYFGPVTKNALAGFQEEYNLEDGIGYFGSETKDYLERISLPVEQSLSTVVFNKNLSLGMSGDDVKALQEALIGEGVWQRSDIEATGYFGQITKEAVIKYQDKYSLEILAPLGLAKGTGFVGFSTRARLEK